MVLVARREERLIHLAEELKENYAVEVRTVVTDLSKENLLLSVAQATDGLQIGLLINNAGFALKGNFLEHSLDDEVALLHVNCRSPMALSHHFGKKMMQRRRGGIINVPSASAFLPIPYWSNYSSSKVQLLHFSEGLGFELKEYGVDVLALCPGRTQTKFAEVADIDMQGGGSPEDVVTAAFRGLGRKGVVVHGIGKLIATQLSRFLTRRLSVLLGSLVVGKQARE